MFFISIVSSPCFYSYAHQYSGSSSRRRRQFDPANMDPYLSSLPAGRRPGPIPRGGRTMPLRAGINDVYGNSTDVFQDGLDGNLEYMAMGGQDDGQYQFGARGAFDKSATGGLPMDDLMGSGVLSTPGMASQPFRMPNGATVQSRSGLTPGLGLLVFGSPNEQTGLTPNNDNTLLSDIACSREMSPYSPNLGIFSFDTSPRRYPTSAGGKSVGSTSKAASYSGGGSGAHGQANNYWSVADRGQDSLEMHNGNHSTPGMCSPDLQKSLIALGVVRGSFSDDENDDPNEISAIDPVDANCVATELDSSGTDLESSILEKVTNSATVSSTTRARRVGMISHSVPSPSHSPSHSPSSPSSDSFNRSPSSVNSSAINVTDNADLSQSSLSASSLDAVLHTRRGSRNASAYAEQQASGRTKRKFNHVQQPDSADRTAKRFGVDIVDVSAAESRETRHRRVRYIN